jgi:hypothetical protein
MMIYPTIKIPSIWTVYMSFVYLPVLDHGPRLGPSRVDLGCRFNELLGHAKTRIPQHTESTLVSHATVSMHC